MSKFVVSAAITDRKTKQILLTKRAIGTTYEKHWCTPGGIVEEGETHLEALRRELGEEIRVSFKPVPLLKCVYTHDIKSTRSGELVTVVCYLIPIEDIEGIPSCGDKTSAVGYFQVDEILDLKMTPADKANIGTLIRAISDE